MHTISPRSIFRPFRLHLELVIYSTTRAQRTKELHCKKTIDRKNSIQIKALSDLLKFLLLLVRELRERLLCIIGADAVNKHTKEEQNPKRNFRYTQKHSQEKFLKVAFGDATDTEDYIGEALYDRSTDCALLSIHVEYY